MVKIAKALACPSVVLPRLSVAFSEGGTEAGRACQPEARKSVGWPVVELFK